MTDVGLFFKKSFFIKMESWMTGGDVISFYLSIYLTFSMEQQKSWMTAGGVSFSKKV